MHPIQELRQAADLLRAADRIVVLSGAGLSKASGIPTYRDTGGLWETGDNLKYSHIDAYKADPAAFTKFWKARQGDIAPAKPNAAHQALHRLQAAKPLTTLITQNVDGLLQAAGCEKVLELHGNLKTARCGQCSNRRYFMFGRCLCCGGFKRPDVVLFGEQLAEEVVTASSVAASRADVVLVVGTSAIVYPAADIPVRALRFGAKLIVMDTEPPLLAKAADIVLQGAAEVLMPELVERALS
jgi:NAD-dependent deacetylase